MAHINSIRELSARNLQVLRDKASLNNRFQAQSLKDLTSRATLTGKKRVARDGQNLMTSIVRKRAMGAMGIGNRIDREA